MCNYFRSLPLHHSQKEEIREDKYSVFAYFIRPTFDFIQEILSMGETVEIVEPQMLRNEIARIGGELVKKNK
ncbi:MAG: WYL domain-containing protein [Bacteroidales bacterium]|nr:WYL domain-containing protein [Bacteroidales bacterium]